ncbi:MAG: hypothetical protein NTV24_04275, partial [Candidatus Woesebacteria bacterium]|nr:hypothetical protein [Candidatus Woesebacteria bacterium]
PQYKYQNKDTNFEITCGSGFGGGGCGLANQKIQDKFFANGTEINGCLERNITNKTVNLWLTYLTLGTDKPTFSFTASAGDTNDNVNLINQILSTFKFTD